MADPAEEDVQSVEAEVVNEETNCQRSCFGTGLAVAGVLVSLVYLLNLGLGGIMEIPDILPVVGNIDEAAAAGILFSCLRYLGLDVLPFKAPGKH